MVYAYIRIFEIHKDIEFHVNDKLERFIILLIWYLKKCVLFKLKMTRNKEEKCMRE